MLRKQSEGWWDRVVAEASAATNSTAGAERTLFALRPRNPFLPWRPRKPSLPQDTPVDISKFDDVPFMLGDMEDHQ